ncbi:hypothetical protein [Limnoglobus roseus]|nr:hypothetical protein [Limnoglobus roseus]
MMQIRGRLNRLVAKVRASQPDAVPWTVFLVEATPGRHADRVGRDRP